MKVEELKEKPIPFCDLKKAEVFRAFDQRGMFYIKTYENIPSHYDEAQGETTVSVAGHSNAINLLTGNGRYFPPDERCVVYPDATISLGMCRLH